jgi:hypothetical protein
VGDGWPVKLVPEIARTGELSVVLWPRPES